MIRPTTDINLLISICSDPHVRRMIGDDFNPEFTFDPSWIYLVEDDLGFVGWAPVNRVCAQLHIALKPAKWGSAVDFGTAAGWWMFNNTSVQKLIAIVPAYNRLAIRAARAGGFRDEGLITKSWSKGFKLHDQVVLGITKQEAYASLRG